MINHHNPDERLSPTEAIKIYTENNAWLKQEENSRGRIATGMCADLSVMDTDFTKHFAWQRSRTLGIVRNGELAYAADQT